MLLSVYVYTFPLIFSSPAQESLHTKLYNLYTIYTWTPIWCVMTTDDKKSFVVFLKRAYSASFSSAWVCIILLYSFYFFMKRMFVDGVLCIRMWIEKKQNINNNGWYFIQKNNWTDKQQKFTGLQNGESQRCKRKLNNVEPIWRLLLSCEVYKWISGIGFFLSVFFCMRHESVKCAMYLIHSFTLYMIYYIGWQSSLTLRAISIEVVYGKNWWNNKLDMFCIRSIEWHGRSMWFIQFSYVFHAFHFCNRHTIRTQSKQTKPIERKKHANSTTNERWRALAHAPLTFTSQIRNLWVFCCFVYNLNYLLSICSANLMNELSLFIVWSILVVKLMEFYFDFCLFCDEIRKFAWFSLEKHFFACLL